MKKFIDMLLPPKSVIPVLATVLFNVLVYYGAKLINSLLDAQYHNFAIPGIDDKIPFVIEFIIIYVLAYLQWAFGYLVLARQEESMIYKFCCACIIAKLVCLVCFIVIPTMIPYRPEVSGSGLSAFVAKIVFAADTPVNLFPSIHCLESYLSARIVFKSKKIPMWIKIANLVLAILVFASVVLVKQHFAIDIPAGILLVEIGLIIVKYTKADRIFAKINARIFKDEKPSVKEETKETINV